MKIVTGLDIGTTKVACLVGELDSRGRIKVIGVGIVPARGIKKGVVVNVEAATEAIITAVEKAERSSGIDINEAYVGVAGSHISAVNSRGAITINHPTHHIEKQDVRRVLKAARTIAIPYSQEIIHVLPRGYWLDGLNGVIDPVGLHAYRLEVEAHIVTAGMTALQTIEKCCELAEIVPRAFVLEPLASGHAVLTEDEKELGVVVIDIGGGTTDISIFLEGAIWHTVSLPIGGDHLSQDLAVGLQASFTVAEAVKKRYGHALPSQVTDSSPVNLPHFGDQKPRSYTREDIADILQYRVADIFDLILHEMKRSGYNGLLPAGLVFCGGSSQLPGLKDAARDFFNLPVRVAIPQNVTGLVDVLRDPAYATSIGILGWGLFHNQSATQMLYKNRKRKYSSYPSLWNTRIRTWLAALLPS